METISQSQNINNTINNNNYNTLDNNNTNYQNDPNLALNQNQSNINTTQPINTNQTNPIGEFTPQIQPTDPSLYPNHPPPAYDDNYNNNNNQDYSNYLATQINQQTPLSDEQIENLKNNGIAFDPSTNPSPMRINGSRIPDLMIDIQPDPRYRRLVFKYAPKKTTKKGFKQYLKNHVDPAALPLFGIFVNLFRTGKFGSNKIELGNMENETAHAEDVSNVTMTSLSGSLDAQLTKQSVKTAIDLYFSWVPVLSTLPATGFKILAYKSSEKLVNQMHLTDTIESDVLYDFAVSKAFLLYLGYPATDDPLYSQWEESRLELKEIFGMNREDNLYEMSYEEWKEEYKDGEAPLVPLLLLLWHVYRCDREQYYEKIKRKKNKQSLEDVARIEREEDKNWLAFNPEFDHDPHVQLVTEMCEDAVSAVLLNEFRNGVEYNFLKTDGEEYSKLEWWVRYLVHYFIEKKQIWAYLEDDEVRTVRAVILWQSPTSEDPVEPLRSSTKLKGRVRIGNQYVKEIKKHLKELDALRQSDLQNREKKHAIIHYFGMWHPPGEANDLCSHARYLIVLLSNVCNMLEDDVVVYAQSHVERAEVLKEVGFRKLPNNLSVQSHINGYLYDRSQLEYYQSDDNDYNLIN